MYSLDNGNTVRLFLSNETIDQTMWSDIDNGTVTLTFYANDTAGNIAIDSITLRKDKESPSIVIEEPKINQIVGKVSPIFEISILEANLNKTWYCLYNNTNQWTENITFTGDIGIINQTLWEALMEGHITIRFYANDSVGNIAYSDVIVIKDLTWPSESKVIIIDEDGNDDDDEEGSDDFLGYTSFFIIGASSGVSTVILTAYIIKKSKSKIR